MGPGCDPFAGEGSSARKQKSDDISSVLGLAFFVRFRELAALLYKGMTEDSELLRRYAEAASEPAFTEFVRRHLRLVYGAALWQTHGRADLAQDIAQVVFTKAARGAVKLSQHATIAGWLYRATDFAARDVLRSERRRLQREREAQILAAATTGPAEIDWEHLRPALNEMLQRGVPQRRRDHPPAFSRGSRFCRYRARAPPDGRCNPQARGPGHGKAAGPAGQARNQLVSSRFAGAPGGAGCRRGSSFLESAVVAGLPASGINAGPASIRLQALVDGAQILSGLAGLVALLVVGTAVYEVKAQIRAEADLAQVSAASRSALGRLREAERLTKEAESRLAKRETAGNPGTQAKPTRRFQIRWLPAAHFWRPIPRPIASWKRRREITMNGPRARGDEPSD